jgi:hypothetical protein
MEPTRHQKPETRYHACRERGAAAILAMMFLVIFSSLAAAMAIVSQGNLATAESHLKVNRSLASAETGMKWLTYRLDQVTATVKTRDGLIDAGNAPALWLQVRDALQLSLANEGHNLDEPYAIANKLHVGPVSLGPGAPPFTAEFIPHPIAGENYNSSYYQRPPYSKLTPAVSNANPLDATWIRVKVISTDGHGDSAISRGIQMDFRLDKKINFAILSKSRVMIGRNVMIEGPIGSRFRETHLQNGHPVQMVSDFRGLDPVLDAALDTFSDWLKVNDRDGDNRLSVASAAETAGIDNPESLDLNGDGFIDEFDFFLNHFDTNGDGRVSATELNTSGNINAAQLLELVDTFGDSGRAGFGDGFIDADDRYVKIRGAVHVAADLSGWQNGAAGGNYQDYFQGPIQPRYGEAPLTFESAEALAHSYGPNDFDVSGFRSKATGDLQAQAIAQAQAADPTDPERARYDNTGVREEVPFGSSYPYDYYQRPVYENMVFENVTIPKGTNALFRNCVFRGVTFVDTEPSNTDANYNYAGMEEADGTPKHPDRSVIINGQEVQNTKTVSNNIRFDGCKFEGAVVSNVPQEYTHVRNKIAFTGRTRFDIEGSGWLSDAEKTLYKRSSILSPHYSVEMGTFVSPADSNETVHLSGAIVAGIIDMRGQIKIDGIVLTTFEPQSNQGPVLGDTSPQFNTTLGYFPKSAGDLEAELPNNGVGVIQIRYDPKLPLPDGILGPIQIKPVVSTYFELGAN